MRLTKEIISEWRNYSPDNKDRAVVSVATLLDTIDALEAELAESKTLVETLDKLVKWMKQEANECLNGYRAATLHECANMFLDVMKSAGKAAPDGDTK